MSDKLQQRNQLFEHAPVQKAVASMAVPTIISMLVVVVYNMADTFFIGQTGDKLQIAAVSLATPVFLLFMALGNLFGIGGSSEIARSLGEKNEARAKRVSSFCCYASVITGLVMLLIYLFGMDGILKLICNNAAPVTIGYAREYLSYVAYGGVFIIFSVCFGNILRAEGAAKESMIGNMIGTIVNLVLDPVMILWLGWGVRGAAIATVIGNVCASIYYIHYLLRRPTVLSIRPSEFSAKKRIAVNVASIGIPASLNNILMSVSNIILNNFLIKYGDDQVAGMGVAMKLNMLVVLLQIGLCTGVQPLIAYNYGAKNPKRLKSVMKFTALSAVVMGTFLTVIVVLLKGVLVKAFIDDQSVIEPGVRMTSALMISGPVLGIMFTCINTLQGMGKALPSLLLTICRQGLVFVPMLFLLNYFFQLDGIIYAQPIADYVSIVFSILICVHIVRKFEHSLAQETGKEV